MNLLGIMLSERSQSENVTYYTFHLYNIPQMAKLKKWIGWLVVAKS